ncbi:hypothetical protein EDM68_01335 [Candidatus Uhrbacteria bacterium]|nr:MAG: hypothetical protein EDM68_01335 [Candidatus Uhrbacteria bacterium]
MGRFRRPRLLFLPMRASLLPVYAGRFFVRDIRTDLEVNTDAPKGGWRWAWRRVEAPGVCWGPLRVA